MNASNANNQSRKSSNQNIQVYVRVRPMNAREHNMRSVDVIDVAAGREIVTRHTLESRLTKKFTFDRAFSDTSSQVEVYKHVVAPFIEEVLAGYNCTVFAYGQTGTGKTHTMIGTENAKLGSSWDDDSGIGIIPRALSHLFDELRLTEMEFSMRISYLELYNEELCDLLSSDDSTKIRIYDDSMKKGSVIIQGLEEIPVHSKDDVYKLLEKGKERRKTAKTLMNAQSSRSHTVFSILVHIRETGIDNEEMLKIGKLNLVDLAGSENVSKAGNEKAIRVRETVNINQSLLTLGRVITALVERTPHVPYRESKLTRLLQESLGGRTKTSIIATISPGHKDIEETLSTLEYAHRAKNIQNKPEVNQKLTQRIVLKEYTEEIDKLKRDLMAARDKNGIYLPDKTYMDMTSKMDAQSRELNEKVVMLKLLKDELTNKERIFHEVSLKLVENTAALAASQHVQEITRYKLNAKKSVLENAKRRYEEKKVILEEQAKTEKLLTDQAITILEVADTATQDTQKLHVTLERRRDVDRNIESASENLVSLLRENFSHIDENLATLRFDSEHYSEVILQELNKAKLLQDNYRSLLEKRIKEMSSGCEEAIKECLEKRQNTKKLLEDVNAERTQSVVAECNELCNANHAFLKELSVQLRSLLVSSEEQESVGKNIFAKTYEYLEQQLQQQHLHTREIMKFMGFTRTRCAESMKRMQLIDETVETERGVLRRQQDRVAKFLQDLRHQQNEFEQDMEGLVESRQAHLTSIAQASTELKESVNDFEEVLQTTAKQSEENLERQELTTQQHRLAISEQVEQMRKSAKAAIATGNALREHIKKHDHQLQCATARIKQVATDKESEASQALCAEIQWLKEHEKHTEERIVKCEKELLAMSDEQRGVLMASNTLTSDKVKSIEKDLIEPFSNTYDALRDNCLEELMFLKQSKLKTYQPTGMTPSKRDYVYPRALASTAPHSQIIKRFRTENNYSDSETTLIIPEDTEIIDPVDVSMSMERNAEQILNSTPIIDNMQKLMVSDGRTFKSNSSKNNSLSVDILKTPGQKRSPRKEQIDKHSSTVATSDKENTA